MLHSCDHKRQVSPAHAETEPCEAGVSVQAPQCWCLSPATVMGGRNREEVIALRALRYPESSLTHSSVPSLKVLFSGASQPSSPHPATTHPVSSHSHLRFPEPSVADDAPISISRWMSHRYPNLSPSFPNLLVSTGSHLTGCLIWKASFVQ